MILTCPECTTRYQTDASLFAPPGRKVKCAKCAHVWLQAAPPPEPELNAAMEEPSAPESVPEPEPQRAAYDAPADYAPAATSYVARQNTYAPATQPKRRGSWASRLALVFGWVALVGAVLLVGWSADSYRQQIASLWPQSSSLYAALGLHVNARGIDIRDVVDNVVKEDGQPVLAVSGTLANITKRELTVPQVSVTLTDDDKRTLYQWSFSSGVQTLKPGQTVRFRTRLSSPPSGVRHLEVRLGGTGK
jgi:predicted Zn finger-like uncharacterized protein